MESVFRTKIASRGCHVYGKTTWTSPKKGQQLHAEKEKDKIALMHDPYAVAWKMKTRDKLIPNIVGHVPKELSRAAWFFLQRGGEISGRVFDEKYRPSPIPNGGLEIMLEVELKIEDEKRKILERLQNIIRENYENDLVTDEYPIHDRAAASLLLQSQTAATEQLDNDGEDDEEEEEDHLINDEDDGVICID